MPPVIAWFSRHAPTAQQVAELRRLYGPDVRVYRDTRTFSGAEEIEQRFRASGAADMVVVAPLSVIAALCERGIKPLWAEMELVPATHSGAEVRIQRKDGRIDHYRFVRFRRISGVRIEYEPITEETHK